MAQDSFGTLLKMGDGGSGFNTIAEVGDITWNGLTATVHEVTSHSTSIPWREFLVGLLTGGTIEFPFWFDPDEATHGELTTGMLYIWKNRIERNWQLVANGGAGPTFQFAAFIQNIGPLSFPVDGVQAGHCVLQVTDIPDFDA